MRLVWQRRDAGGNPGVGGATRYVLKRSLDGMATLAKHSLAQVRPKTLIPGTCAVFQLPRCAQSQRALHAWSRKRAEVRALTVKDSSGSGGTFAINVPRFTPDVGSVSGVGSTGRRRGNSCGTLEPCSDLPFQSRAAINTVTGVTPSSAMGLPAAES